MAECGQRLDSKKRHGKKTKKELETTPISLADIMPNTAL